MCLDCKRKKCLENLGSGGGGGGGLAAAFDLAAFRQDMIAPVKKSVNHSETVTSMREMRNANYPSNVTFCP